MKHGNASYRKRVNLLKNVQLILVILCIVMLLVYLYYITRPKLSSYDLKDECGPIGGSISHPLDDTDSCSNACLAYCTSIEKKLHDSKFELKDPQCNS